jgi:ornithine cyclodeaminase
MSNYKVLTDADIKHLLSMKDVVEAVELAFKSKAVGALVSPPRFHVDTAKGSLVFTAGAETKACNVIGFRVYDSFHVDSQQRSTDRVQLVSVFDSETGDFKGVVIGSLIGALRTGALGGVAIKYLSAPESSSVGILGSGFQARTQLEAACAVRNIKFAKVFSPNPQNREAFAAEMSELLKLKVQAVATAQEVVSDVDILICATSSNTPVFDASWLKAGVHINTLGPKLVDSHEISLEVAERCQIICTDSLSQLNAYDPPYFLTGTSEMERVADLSEIIAGRKPNRASSNEMSLFLSVGLAGTEVVVADAAIIKANELGKE